jgi:hypothetical protein
MQKFFVGNVQAGGQVSVGDSSLVGPYECQYCGEPCAQYGRFQIYLRAPDLYPRVGKLNFCLPECALTYLIRKISTIGTDDKAYMAYKIREVAGRSVYEAPIPGRLYKYDRRNGLKREQWLSVARKDLTPAEMDVANQELVVQSLLETTTRIQ